MTRKLNDYEKLFTQGKNISAIQLYRERNGCDLADAKHAIEEMIVAYHSSAEGEPLIGRPPTGTGKAVRRKKK